MRTSTLNPGDVGAGPLHDPATADATISDHPSERASVALPPDAGAASWARRHRRAFLNVGLAALLVGSAAGAWTTMRPKAKTTTAAPTVVTASTGSVSTTVSGSGNVLASTSYDVTSPSSSAVVTEVDVKLGDKVTKGQVLGKVDDTALQAAAQSADAQLAQAQANLDKLKATPSATDVAGYDAADEQATWAVTQAEVALTNARTALATDTTQQAAAVAQAQAALTAAQTKATLDLANAQAAVDSANATLTADQAKLTAAQAALAAATTDADRTARQAAVDAATAAVAKDQQSVGTAAYQLQTTTLSTQQSVTSATNAVANATASQTAKLTADKQAITNAQHQVTTAEASRDLTVAQNATKRQGPAAADVAVATAAVTSATNAATTAHTNLAAATLTAPGAGTVTVLNAKVGSAGSSSSSSAASSGSSATGSAASSTASTSVFATVVDLGQLQVKAGFSESDAVKLAAGQSVSVTFDSLSATTITGTVQSVDVTSTTVSNVVTYYAYITLANPPSTVKPGMTATLVVTTSKVDDVVTLPATAVSSRGTTATVNVQTGATAAQTTPTQITIGVRGDSTVEVKSGLKAGDKVVVAARTTTASGSSGTTGTGGTTRTTTASAAATGLTGGGAPIGGGGAPPAGGFGG